MAIKSGKGKGSYATYKSENRAYKNKILKLEKHCKKFPEDELAKENLKRLQDPKNFKQRSKPLNPGSNSPAPEIHTYAPPAPKPETAGEQLSKLLGIKLKKYRRRTKPSKTPVTIKKRKNVEKS
jgi:hypothetical protein